MIMMARGYLKYLNGRAHMTYIAELSIDTTYSPLCYSNFDGTQMNGIEGIMNDIRWFYSRGCNRPTTQYTMNIHSYHQERTTSTAQVWLHLSAVSSSCPRTCMYWAQLIHEISESNDGSNDDDVIWTGLWLSVLYAWKRTREYNYTNIDTTIANNI